ncbi:engulfment and cell motility protein 2-like [Ornithodoros turicata]|uniref:engulfment and cell motility protein 2-like n=1 Tax=Ornithodoros turicata TaxID=34597 RepID=UPI003139548E
MSTMKNGTTIKIGVKIPDRDAELLEVDLSAPLADFVEDLCRREGITNAQDYALAFADRKTGYIVESRKQDIKNGDLLQLTRSPSKVRQEIIEKLSFGAMDGKALALGMLHERVTDPVFAREFTSNNGHKLLVSAMENGFFRGKIMGKALQCFEGLMDHNILSWDIVSEKFVTRLIRHVSSSSHIDNMTVETSLSILESAATQRFDLYTVIHTTMPFGNYVNFVGNGSIPVLKNALALLNIVFKRAEHAGQRALEGLILKFGLKNMIWHRLSHMTQVDIELAHQLFVMQSLLLNLYQEMRTSVFDLKDTSHEQKIKLLLKYGFDIDPDDQEAPGNRSSNRFSAEFKTLGIRYTAAPIKDFMKPCGKLALHSLAYFAEHDSSSFSRLVQENSSSSQEHSCPLAASSIKLAELLCNLFHIGETVADQGVFYPMFFSTRYFLEELFIVGMKLVFKTWCEMRATTEDIDKVFGIVREQIIRTLKSEQNSPTIQDFRRSLWQMPYSVVVSELQKERAEREEWESQSAAVRQLRRSLVPDVMELVETNRLNFLCRGTMFQRYTQKGQRLKDKYCYAMLSHNHKYLHYGECAADDEPILEELQHSQMVSEIAGLYTGADCPHARKGNKAITDLAFSIVPRYEEPPLNFVAPNEVVFQYWIDGLNALIGRPMTSEETQRDLETLLHMEIKLRLLETEGLSIPEVAPPIPPSPENYDFHI